MLDQGKSSVEIRDRTSLPEERKNNMAAVTPGPEQFMTGIHCRYFL